MDLTSDKPPPLTVNVSLAVLPVPPFVEVTAPVVFTCVPPEAMTSTAIVQVPPPTMEPLLNDRLVSVAAGAKVGVLEALQPVMLTFGGLATWMPTGKESIKATPVSVVLGFRICDGKS